MIEPIAYDARETSKLVKLSYNRIIELANRGETWLDGRGVVATTSRARVAS